MQLRQHTYSFRTITLPSNTNQILTSRNYDFFAVYFLYNQTYVGRLLFFLPLPEAEFFPMDEFAVMRTRIFNTFSMKIRFCSGRQDWRKIKKL